MSDAPAKPDNTRYGLIAMATGIGVAIMVRVGSQPGDAPVWVGDACAAAFFCAGVAIVAAPRGWTLLGQFAGLIAAYMLVVPGLWVVFGGDPDRCSITAAIGSLTLGEGGGGLCRGIFGAGALLTLGFAILFTWTALRRRPQKPDMPPN